MSEETSFSNTPSSPEKSSRRSNFVGVFFVILFLVIIILVGLYFLGASKKNTFDPIKISSPTPTSTPKTKITPKATPTPTISPTPMTLKRSALEISVLNGSGVAGAAKGISTKLSTLGYTVKTVGNADQFTYTGITIKVKKEKSAYLDMLKKDVTSGSITVTATVDDTITDDADVIVGK